MKWIFWIAGIVLVAALIVQFFLHRTPERWAVYYRSTLPYADFHPYRVVAFDSDDYPDFSQRHKGQVVLGYLSTSEAETYRPYYSDIMGMGVVLPPSDRWPGKQVVDIRSQRWRDYFVDVLVPGVLAKGFDGIMIDTIDTPLWLEEQYPQEFGGMREAAIDLIQSIRRKHPEAKLMLNRGFQIVDAVAGDVDYLLAESIRLHYNPATGNASLVPQHIYDELSGQLKAAKKRHSHLKVMSLDYTDMKKHSEPLIRQVYAEQRDNGFIPYMTTFDLAQRHEEPQ